MQKNSDPSNNKVKGREHLLLEKSSITYNYGEYSIDSSIPGIIKYHLREPSKLNIEDLPGPPFLNMFHIHNCNINIQDNLSGQLHSLISHSHGETTKCKKDNVTLPNNRNVSQKKAKKGFAYKLKRFIKDLGDEESNLFKSKSGLKSCIKIIQKLGSYYNRAVLWLSLVCPELSLLQIPKWLLGE
ncbi:MAG: hypothetical protein MI974_32220 [Chitinophagales bacterium]|nr:hypothetical protein [Chitinophagales bacterium]